MLLKLSVIATIFSLTASAVTASAIKEHDCYRSSPIPGHKGDWQLHTYPVPQCHHRDSKGHKVHSTIYHDSPKGACECHPIKAQFKSFSYTTQSKPGQAIQFFSETGCHGTAYSKPGGNSNTKEPSVQTDWQDNNFAHNAKSFRIC
ncbi:hypothetical protein BJ138DRAFT_1167862 [Hygrophoropsis aurantiaca]|uniref:Uncharacterized protein n=1 Tax=Hygrophoropsis aurantiaca TaxID=72124 RepID=A0ACB7ZSD8_9AGAM|nr:hypothetical protein BJ138DRAFT_1167862 [Hygrophoropsis aurantiaca]